MRTLIILSVMFATASFGATDLLHVTEDTFGFEYYPSVPQGDALDLQIRFNSSGLSAATYVKFDLAGYSGLTLLDSTLWLYCFTNVVPSGDIWYGAVNANWSETTLTWYNMPGVVAGTQATEPYPSGADMWWSCNVTGIVQDWLDGTYTNHGIALWDNDSPNSESSYHTKEHGDPDLEPILNIHYTTSGIESKTLGEVKATFR